MTASTSFTSPTRQSVTACPAQPSHANGAPEESGARHAGGADRGRSLTIVCGAPSVFSRAERESAVPHAQNPSHNQPLSQGSARHEFCDGRERAVRSPYRASAAADQAARELAAGARIVNWRVKVLTPSHPERLRPYERPGSRSRGDAGIGRPCRCPWRARCRKSRNVS